MQKKSLGSSPGNAGYEQKIGSTEVLLSPGEKPASSWGGQWKSNGAGVLVGVGVFVGVLVAVGVFVAVGWLAPHLAPGLREGQWRALVTRVSAIPLFGLNALSEGFVTYALGTISVVGGIAHARVAFGGFASSFGDSSNTGVGCQN